MKYFKGDPSRYTIKYRSGKMVKHGVGTGFWYLKRLVSIASIPIMTIDAHFIFNELTKNYQEITLQGHFTYKIKDPLKISTLLNFTVDPKTGHYLSEDPEKIELRIKNVVQQIVKSEIFKLDLKTTLFYVDELSKKVMEQIGDNNLIAEMGIEFLSCTFTSIRASPDISKALEAEYRESLQRKADEAIYARRAAAVEQESKIKENQLQTQILLEEERKKFIELEGENKLAKAEYSAKATELELKNYETISPDKLLAYSFKLFAENAEKIGELNFTTEVLAELLRKKKSSES